MRYNVITMSTPYTRLSFRDREEISRGIWANESFVAIARRIHRPLSTVTREVWKNTAYRWCYRAERAQQSATQRKRKGRVKILETRPLLQAYVHGKLRQQWSPEEIAKRLKLEYPQDTVMRISHEAIYQHLYCLPRGELKKELLKGLRQGRKMRTHRGALHARRSNIRDIISISERPKEAEGRIVPGHWEGDLVVGKNHESAIGTLVERTTRLTLLVPLADKDAFAVRTAFANAFQQIPRAFRKTLTYDRGSEMAEHALFSKETKIRVFFADPHSPWQRGTNENTNGLIRQYFPKGIDFHQIPPSALKEAEQRLNSRPRKVLGFYTPAEKFYELITGQKIALGG